MPHFSKYLLLNGMPNKYVGALNATIGKSPYHAAHDKSQSIFIHIPKAAGTSISISLYGAMLGHTSAEVFRRYDKVRFQNYFKFAFVRHPETRFVSGWQYLQAGGRTRADRFFATQYLSRFKSRVDFLEALADEHRKGRCHRLLAWGHFKAQCSFIFEGNELLVNFIGRFENIDQDFFYVSEKIFGYRASLQKLNSSKRAHNVTINRYERQLIREIWASDYEKLGYGEQI